MKEHFRTLSAVFPVIMRSNDGKLQVLLHRRKNTGYMDGKWDMVGSGHIDQGETAKQAVVRECREEIGIEINIEDVEFALLLHKMNKINDDDTYFNMYFKVNKFSGQPSICEPDKCSEQKWFDVDKLPEDMIKDRKIDWDHM